MKHSRLKHLRDRRKTLVTTIKKLKKYIRKNPDASLATVSLREARAELNMTQEQIEQAS